jgi:hypothetical protein
MSCVICKSIQYLYKQVFGADILLDIHFSKNINIYSSLRVTDQF